jgi:predicted nucleotide-binding protein
MEASAASVATTPQIPQMSRAKIPAVATIEEILAGLDAFRDELATIRRAPSIDDTLRDAKLGTFTKRAYTQLKDWGFETEAEQGFGRNSVINLYIGTNAQVEAKDARLHALRDDVASHPEHYKSRLAIGEQSESSSAKHASVKTKVFLGHGRNKLWARVQIFLKDELHLDVEAWETETRAGQHSIDVLKKALDSSAFAVLVLTGEDATADGAVRARQNVVHEIGLFQGRLGFEKVALLQQNGVEGFSNLAGLQIIKFSDEQIENSFYELRRMLEREGLVK